MAVGLAVGFTFLPFGFHVSTVGATNTYGMPVPWAAYVFPGGASVTALCSLTGAGACATTSYPVGGSKGVPTAGAFAAGSPQLATLNKLRADFGDATYFAYQYEHTGAGATAVATVSAFADFNAAAPYHTIVQRLGIGADQEVAITPAATTNEFE